MNLKEAFAVLSKNNYKYIKEADEVETAANSAESTVVVTLSIKHTSCINADNRSTAGRRLYHMNARRYGLRDSVEVNSNYDSLNEESVEQMGSQKLNGEFKEGDVKVKQAWSWVDVALLEELLADEGFKLVDESHEQATVTRDTDETPVADWGHDGPYGENTNYITHFLTIVERDWSFTISGPTELIENYDERDWLKICHEAMPAYVGDGVGYDDKVTISKPAAA